VTPGTRRLRLRLTMTARTSTWTTCETTVAEAAPAMPIPQPRTSQRSRARLSSPPSTIAMTSRTSRARRPHHLDRHHRVPPFTLSQSFLVQCPSSPPAVGPTALFRPLDVSSRASGRRAPRLPVSRVGLARGEVSIMSSPCRLDNPRGETTDPSSVRGQWTGQRAPVVRV